MFKPIVAYKAAPVVTKIWDIYDIIQQYSSCDLTGTFSSC